MRWGAGTGPWVRPVHGVVALFEGQVVPFELFGIQAGRESAGHSTLSPKGFPVKGVEDYLAALGRLRHRRLSRRSARGFSLERMTARAQDARRRAGRGLGAARQAGGDLRDPGSDGGLRSLPALCALPREVLATSLRDHQSALTVEKDGALLPVFLTVMDRPDDPAGRVRAGNEWVVAARLADAKFFFEKDRATPLADRREGLAKLTFQEKLGSYAEKSARLVALVRGDRPRCRSRRSRRGAVGRGVVEGRSRDRHGEGVHRPAGRRRRALRARRRRAGGGLAGDLRSVPAGGSEGRPAARRGRPGDGARRSSRHPRRLLRPRPDPDRARKIRSDSGAQRSESFASRSRARWRSNLEAALGVAFGLLHEKLPVKGVVDGGAAVPSPNVPPAQAKAFDQLVEFLRDRLTHVLGERGFAYDEVAAAMGADSDSPLAFRAIAARAAALQERSPGARLRRRRASRQAHRQYHQRK